MSAVTLRAGPIATPGFTLVRTGLRWLVVDGQRVAAGEPIAFCNIGVRGRGALPFGDEGYDLQIAFAPRIGGRIARIDASPGGFLDRLASFAWDAELPLCRIDDPHGDPDGPADEPRLLMLAGRRYNEIAGDRTSLHIGWHDRSRAWWGEAGEGATLLALGTCEQSAIVRGEAAQYRELFASVAGPVHVIVGQEEPLVPCARTIVEQARRSGAERDAIRRDIADGLLAGPVPLAAGEWVFAGALVNALMRSPLNERPDLLTRAGLAPAPPPVALSLSLTAELPHAARHRRLGYTLNLHGFRLATVGPALRHWLRTSFEPLPRGADAIAADYRALVALAAERGIATFVLNSVSTQGYEDIASYAGLDDATFAQLGTVRAKTLNLMLHDLARDHAGLHVVDADAIAADLGTRAHLPDGVHPSGALQAEMRGELLRSLRGAGVRGFGGRSPSPSGEGLGWGFTTNVAPGR